MESCYGAQPVLHFGEHTILSCCGVQQGDPLGPLGFALTLQPLIECIAREVPSLRINAWYLDDGTLCGPPDALAKALHIIERDGPARGLHLNRAKSCLFIPVDADPSANLLPPEIPVVRDGFTLLGCPIGPPCFCDHVVQTRVDKIGDHLSSLTDLEDSQMEIALLRSCLALPKLSFSLRTCPPMYIQQACSNFDNLMRDTLSDIVGCPIPDWQWLKASLPSSLGGLNLRRASLHASAAFIGSLVLTEDLSDQVLDPDTSPCLHLSDTINLLALAANQPTWTSLQTIDVPCQTRSLSRSIDKASHSLLLSSSPDTRFSALAFSTALPHAGDWLNSIPSISLGLHLHDSEFRVCLCYWLGLRIQGENLLCPVCSLPSDEFGDHGIGCGGNRDRIQRHDAVRDVLFAAAQTAALAPRKEVPSLIPNSFSRPADIFLPTWERGRPAALDVTIISPMQHQSSGCHWSWSCFSGR